VEGPGPTSLFASSSGTDRVEAGEEFCWFPVSGGRVCSQTQSASLAFAVGGASDVVPETDLHVVAPCLSERLIEIDSSVEHMKSCGRVFVVAGRGVAPYRSIR